MELRAVHYSLGRREWTFEFVGGPPFRTRIRPVAERLAAEHDLPLNRQGFRLTSEAPPGGESVIV